MSKSKLDIFVAIAEKLRNSFKINGISTDGSNDVVVTKLGLSIPSTYTPQSILNNNVLVESGYLAFRTLGSNVDSMRFTSPSDFLACTCLVTNNTLTLSAIQESTGDVYIYTALNTSTEWTLKSQLGRSDGAVGSADRLTVPRLINGVGFDGSQDVVTSNWGPNVSFNLTGAVTGAVLNQKGNVPVSISTTLSPTGVSSGTYGKVTVGIDGRVTAGTSLVQTDIPALPASRITSGEFTAARLPLLGIGGTLAQYNTSGDVTGFIKIRLPPVLNNKLITFNVTTIDERSPHYGRRDLTVTGFISTNWIGTKVLLNGDFDTDIVVGKDTDGVFYVSLQIDKHIGIRVHGLTVGYVSNYRTEVETIGWTIALDATRPNSVPVTLITNVRSDNIGTLIPNLDASKITSGVLADARIPSLSASKITSGVLDVSRIPTIPVNKVTGAMVDGGRITGMAIGTDRPLYSSAGVEAGAPDSPSTFPTYSFHKVGVYAATLSAISPYEFAFYRQDGITLAHVDAYLNGSLINRGSVPAAHIENLDTSKITTGTFHTDRIPSIPVTKVTGLGGLSTKNIIISTAEPDNAVGVEGDLWGVIQ